MLAKPLLFLSSFAPLFTLLAIRFERWPLVIACAALALLGVISLALLFRLDRRASVGVHRVVEARDAGAEAGAYLGTYLLPFVTVSNPSLRDSVAYIGFLAVVASIYLRSSVVQINPLLYVLGYKVQSIIDSGGLRGYVITRTRISAGDDILATRFGNDVLMNRSLST